MIVAISHLYRHVTDLKDYLAWGVIGASFSYVMLIKMDSSIVVLIKFHHKSNQNNNTKVGRSQLKLILSSEPVTHLHSYTYIVYRSQKKVQYLLTLSCVVRISV